MSSIVHAIYDYFGAYEPVEQDLQNVKKISEAAAAKALEKNCTFRQYVQQKPTLIDRTMLNLWLQKPRGQNLTSWKLKNVDFAVAQKQKQHILEGYEKFEDADSKGNFQFLVKQKAQRFKMNREYQKRNFGSKTDRTEELQKYCLQAFCSNPVCLRKHREPLEKYYEYALDESEIEKREAQNVKDQEEAKRLGLSMWVYLAQKYQKN